MFGYTVELDEGEKFSPWLVTFRVDGPMMEEPITLFTLRTTSESLANWMAQTIFNQLGDI